MPARTRARQQHGATLAAGDQQHERDGAEEHEECRSDVADDHGFERRHRHRAGLYPGNAFSRFAAYGGHLRLGRRHRRPWPQSREQAQALASGDSTPARLT